MRPQDRPENQALRLSVRPALEDADITELRLLTRRGLDWIYLFKLARRHSLLPLLHRRLRQFLGDLVPPEELEQFKIASQQNTARNLLLTNELCELIKTMERAGIEAIPFKGPVLALVAYGDIALRRFIDLDLMVRKDDVPAAINVIQAWGYSPAKDLTRNQQELLLRVQHNLQFTREEGKLLVELHWQVSSHLFASTVTAEELWQNLETVVLNGTKLKTLAGEDLLFSLCVHGSRHLWERLAWICDVAHLVVKKPEIRWLLMLDRAQRSGAERMLLLGLFLASTLLDVSLPELVKERLERDKRLSLMAREIESRLFDGTEHVPATAREVFRYNMQVRDSFSSRARYALFMFEPTDSDLSALRLSPALRFAYYVVRPFRLLTQRRSR